MKRSLKTFEVWQVYRSKIWAYRVYKIDSGGERIGGPPRAKNEHRKYLGRVSNCRNKNDAIRAFEEEL